MDRIKEGKRREVKGKGKTTDLLLLLLPFAFYLSHHPVYPTRFLILSIV
jgi:hypothetical protein